MNPTNHLQHVILLQTPQLLRHLHRRKANQWEEMKEYRFFYVFLDFLSLIRSISLSKWKSSLKISQTISSPALSSKPYCRIKSSTCASTLRRPSCQPSQPAVPAGGGGWPMGTPRLASTARMRERSTAEGLRGLPLKSFSMICCWTYFLGKFKKKRGKEKALISWGHTWRLFGITKIWKKSKNHAGSIDCLMPKCKKRQCPPQKKRTST